jgi:hypothetical protein
MPKFPYRQITSCLLNSGGRSGICGVLRPHSGAGDREGQLSRDIMRGYAMRPVHVPFLLTVITRSFLGYFSRTSVEFKTSTLNFSSCAVVSTVAIFSLSSHSVPWGPTTPSPCRTVCSLFYRTGLCHSVCVMGNDGNFSLQHRVQTGSGAHPAS